MLPGVEAGEIEKSQHREAVETKKPRRSKANRDPWTTISIPGGPSSVTCHSVTVHRGLLRRVPRWIYFNSTLLSLIVPALVR